MRRLAALTATLGLLGLIPALAQATPAAPDIAALPAVTDPGFRDNVGDLYFQTPDGLLCAILITQRTAGCSGRLPSAPDGANEVTLTGTDASFQESGIPRFVRASGPAAPVLTDGHRIADGDLTCAVSGGATSCVTGAPPAHWFVLSPGGSGIGPATHGLPPGFPDPQNFVASGAAFIVGQGPKNIFPTFHVGNGLTCQIRTFSGGFVGCSGPLPGTPSGQGTVEFELLGSVRLVDDDRYAKPDYPGEIRTLPVGQSVSGTGGSTCMALADGVACYGILADKFTGFVVDGSGVHTFG